MLSAGACSTALAARLQLSIDISCPQAAQQQTRWPLLLLSTDVTDRQTDTRSLQRHCSAYYAGGVRSLDGFHA